jgi:hypothetical protein
MNSPWHTLQESSAGSTPNLSEYHQKHSQCHCTVTRSKTRLKRRNKIITGDVISHLLKHKVSKSFCEDRTGESLIFPELTLTF